MESDNLELLIQHIRCLATGQEVDNLSSSKSNLAWGNRSISGTDIDPLDKNSIPSESSKANIRRPSLKNIWEKLDCQDIP